MEDCRVVVEYLKDKEVRSSSNEILLKILEHSECSLT